MTVSDMQKPTGEGGSCEDFTNAADGKLNTKSHAVTQAKIGLLREDIVETIGPMIATLQAAVAMGHIPNDAGLIYGLRTAQAYWRSISWSARELQRLREGDLPDSPASSSTGGRQ
jgi:hypothetical protein